MERGAIPMGIHESYQPDHKFLDLNECNQMWENFLVAYDWHPLHMDDNGSMNGSNPESPGWIFAQLGRLPIGVRPTLEKVSLTSSYYSYFMNTQNVP